MVFATLQRASSGVVLQRWSLVIACALALCFDGVRGALDGMTQAIYSLTLYYFQPYLSNYVVEATLAFLTWTVICLYFTYLDVTRAPSKIQKDYWPTAEEMIVAAVPQFFAYMGGCGYTWWQWYSAPEFFALDLPEEAPTFLRFSTELAVALTVGDFLIYWEHRIMHDVPWLRNNIHSVHHVYSAPFSWAGGWVHPIEVGVVVIAQVIPAYFCHPFVRWAFAILWTVLLIDEHSGHDVWWSPYNWLIPGHRTWGGGADPHDIHHYMPTKNYSFCFCVWDILFGTYVDPSAENVNGFIPPLSYERRTPEQVQAIRAQQVAWYREHKEQAPVPHVTAAAAAADKPRARKQQRGWMTAMLNPLMSMVR